MREGENKEYTEEEIKAEVRVKRREKTTLEGRNTQAVSMEVTENPKARTIYW